MEKFEEKKNLISIKEEMENSFIDYAMSVIVSRAIPDARDGLKPVHRRILYAMYGLDMTHSKSFKKSARAVGEVIAKYHPHGDSAVYDSLVRMAQSFSLRYPLVLGQGNFGSIDGDSAAAMRYTESKLSKISSFMLEDIKKDTVIFQENYDGAETEPTVLPSKIPNLLINGSTGIAVGMATSIPPHNIVDVLKAAETLLKNKDTSIDEIIDIIKAPDFPTGSLIINKDEIREAYKTGRGRIIQRSKYKIEFNEAKNSGKIIIEEIPYMVNKSNLIIKIADLVKNKTLESISDINDESNRKGIRIVIKLKRGFIPEVELNKLFKLTPLQNSFSMNMLALVDSRPRKLNIKEAIEIYLEHQINILLNKTKFNLEKSESKSHILEGLQIALENIDEVISIIKKSPSNKEATFNLISKFNFTEKQTKSILEMKLQRLTGLERNNLMDELKELKAIILDLKDILNSEERRKIELIKLFDKIIEIFGDERKTEISPVSITNIDSETLIPREDVVITLSKKGYIKRYPINEYRQQNRGGQGSKASKINDLDFIHKIIVTNTHTDLLFFTDLGKVFKTRVHKIPNLGKSSKGIPLINLIDKEKDEEVKSLLCVEDYSNSDLFFVTQRGIVKKTSAQEFSRVNRNGKIAINFKEKDSLLGVNIIDSDKKIDLILGNKNGKVIRFNSKDLRNLGRTASGVRGMMLEEGESVVNYTSVNNKKLILSLSELGYGKMTDENLYKTQNRGGKGIKSLNIKKAGNLIFINSVTGTEDLIIITNKATLIRINLEQVSQSSRNTKGVKLFNLKEGELITSAAVTPLKKINQVVEEKTQEIKLINKEV